jgi:hypothetical protein
LKRPRHHGERDQRLLQEAAHTIFPLQRLGDFLIKNGVGFTLLAQKGVTLRGRPSACLSDEFHDPFVVFRTGFHCPRPIADITTAAHDATRAERCAA